MLGVALGIVGSVASAAMQDAAAQDEYQRKAAVWKQNVINSEAASRDEQRQIITKQLQEQDKTVQKQHVSQIEQAQKVATAEVSAAAGNVSGVSVDNIVADITGKSLLNRTYVDQNYKYTVMDTAEQLKATDTRMASRINSVERPIEPRSTVGLALLTGIAGGVGKMAGSGSLSI